MCCYHFIHKNILLSKKLYRFVNQTVGILFVIVLLPLDLNLLPWLYFPLKLLKFADS